MKAKKTETIEAVMIVDPSEYGLDKEQGKEMESQFLPVIAERNILAEEYTRIVGLTITPAIEKEAGDLRRKFVKVRTNTDSIHKVAKAYFLAGGRYVDAWKNKNNVIVEQMEEKLKEIETTTERARVEVAQKLEADRLAELAIYTKYPPQGLAFMPEDVYQNYLVGVKVSFEKRKEEAEKAEAERVWLIEVGKLHEKRKDLILPAWQFIPLAKTGDNFGELTEEEWKERFDWTMDQKAKAEAEQERVRIENEQLRKEAEVKAAELEIERKKQAQILADQQAKAEQERKALEEKARKEREEQAAVIIKEREAREKLANSLRVIEELRVKLQKEAERQESERKAAEEKAAKAPDKEKMIKWIDSLNIAVPELSNINSKATANLISQKFEGFKNWAKIQIETI